MMPKFQGWGTGEMVEPFPQAESTGKRLGRENLNFCFENVNFKMPLKDPRGASQWAVGY